MKIHNLSFRHLLIAAALWFNVAECSATDWRTAALPAPVLNIAESNGTFWVCGADELIAASVDGGNTWTTEHIAMNGSLLLAIGFANEQFGYAAGTGGRIFTTRDGGNTRDSVKVPSDVVYEADFADEKHGIIHTPQNIYITSEAELRGLLCKSI